MLFLLLLVSGSAHAHAQVIHGRVLDDVTATPLDLVAIELRDAADAVRGIATTDSAGRFSIRAPAEGAYRLRLTRLGYATVVTDTVSVSRGEQVELELRMNVEAVAIDPLRVVARAEYLPMRLQQFHERAEWVRRSGVGRVFLREDILRMGVSRTGTILRMVPIRPDCPLTLLLDGMPVDSAALDAVAPPESLAGVEFYTGPAQMPAEFAGRGYCAVAMFWTHQDLAGARPFSLRRLAAGLGILIAALLLLR
jgi:hypothetical protein